MSAHAHRIVATRIPWPPLTCWRYRRESRLGTAFSIFLADADAHALPALADIAVTAPQPSRTAARVVVAATLDRLPGLTIVTVPVGSGACLFGDRSGEIALADGVPAELAAVAGFLWLAGGRRLGALEQVRANGPDPATDLVVVSGRWHLGLAQRRRPERDPASATGVRDQRPFPLRRAHP
ncbi:hypothetical protein [Amycolatopsis sp. lyj-346]|uniref:hypothetical protein n=1 Tax=Amycolatopsis sp. lyj-346 TaxID=2789289 RepID=UPI0039784119